MKKTITPLFLLISLCGASQSVEEKKVFLEKSSEKAVRYEQQSKHGLREPNTSPNKVSSPNSFPFDTDNDGMPDAWENSHLYLNWNDPKDAWSDLDSDKVINLFEYELNSDPNWAGTPTYVDVHAGGNVTTAVDNALPGQLIRVEAGTYFMNYYSIPKTVMIQGGWNSTFTSRDPYNTPTTFDGQNTDIVLAFILYGNANIVLDGITITNGSAGLVKFSDIITSVYNVCFKDCKLTNESSTAYEAAEFLIGDTSASEVFIVNTLAANNSSSGVGIFTQNNSVAKVHVINSTFTNNIEDGLTVSTNDAAVTNISIINSIIYGNQATDLYAIQFGGPLTIDASSSDIGITSVTNGATYIPGAGMINTNPLFINSTADYHLAGGSPCIDAGIDVGLPFGGAAPDMGVYQTGLSAIDNINSDNEISITPNPCKSYINIETNGQNKFLSSLVITNLLGEKQREVKLNYQSKAKIDVSDLPSGLYFVKLQTEKGSAVQKFIKE